MRPLRTLLTAALIGAAALAQGETPSTPAMRVVSEAEIVKYLKAVDKLQQLGIGEELRTRSGQAPRTTYPAAMVRAVENEGFGQESFTSVHWNVMLAYMAMEMEARQPEIDAARKKQAAQMQAMKGRMPPEQYEALMNGMSGMDRMDDMMRLYEDVPRENVALVKKHRAKIDAILKRDRSPR